MSTVVVWVLSFTVLGSDPEYKTFAKYKTKQECEQVLEQVKLEYKAKKKSIAGSCTLTMK